MILTLILSIGFCMIGTVLWAFKAATHKPTPNYERQTPRRARSNRTHSCRLRVRSSDRGWLLLCPRGTGSIRG